LTNTRIHLSIRGAKHMFASEQCLCVCLCVWPRQHWFWWSGTVSGCPHGKQTEDAWRSPFSCLCV